MFSCKSQTSKPRGQLIAAVHQPVQSWRVIH